MLWNVDLPADMMAIHSAYRSAGSDLITTNSFGGSSFMLNRHGLADRVEELNRAAALIAPPRQAKPDGCSEMSGRSVISSNQSAILHPINCEIYFDSKSRRCLPEGRMRSFSKR